MVATAVADAIPLGCRGSPKSQSERRVYAVVPRVDGLHGGGQGRRRSNGGVGDGDGAPLDPQHGGQMTGNGLGYSVFFTPVSTGARVVGVSDV